MAVCELTHEIPGGPILLERLARQLFDKQWRQLNDSESRRIWTIITEQEKENSDG